MKVKSYLLYYNSRMRSTGFPFRHEMSSKEKYLKDYKAFKSRRKPFSKNEDQDIINWILKYESFNLLTGKTIWKIMESKVCNDKRPWPSLQERFNQFILPNIESYNLPFKIIQKFRRAEQGVANSVSSEQKETAGDSEETAARKYQSLKKRQFHKKRSPGQRQKSSEEEEENTRKAGRRRQRRMRSQELRENSESWGEAGQSDQKSDREDTESTDPVDEQQEHPSVLRENPESVDLLVDIPDVEIERGKETSPAPDVNPAIEKNPADCSEEEEEEKSSTAGPAGTNKNTESKTEEETGGNSSNTENTSGGLTVNADTEYSSQSDGHLKPSLGKSRTDSADTLPDVEADERSVGDGREENGESGEGLKEDIEQRAVEVEESMDQSGSKVGNSRPENKSDTENTSERLQVPANTSASNLFRGSGSHPEVESMVGTPDWQQAVSSTFRQQEEENGVLTRSVGDGKEESGGGGAGSEGEEVEVEGGEEEEVGEEEEGEISEPSFELLPVEPLLRPPKRRRRKTVDHRTKISDKVISGQLQNSSNLLPDGIRLPNPKHVPGELLFRRSGRNCGSFLSLSYRNTVRSLPRTDQSNDWPLNCFSPEAPEPSCPDEEQVEAAEQRGENDYPAAEDRSPTVRGPTMTTWRRLEAKLGENDEELVLVIKGIRRPDALVDEPGSKRMRIIFVSD